jgi:hypothetical protein
MALISFVPKIMQGLSKYQRFSLLAWRSTDPVLLVDKAGLSICAANEWQPAPQLPQNGKVELPISMQQDKNKKLLIYRVV